MKSKFARSIGALLLAAFLHVSGYGLAQAAPAGSVIDVVGGVMVARGGGKVKAGLFDNLFAGDLLQVSSGGKLVVTHNARKMEYSVTVPGEFEVTADDIKARGSARLISKNLTELAVASLDGDGAKGRTTVGAVRMRGASPPPTTPQDGETVLTTTPELSWPATPAVSSYQFVLKTAEGKQLFEIGTDRPALKLDAASMLEWGGRYQWFVTADQNGARVSIVKTLKVIDKAEAESLAQLKPLPEAEFSSWVIYAKALEHVGAFSEAKAAWALMQKMRPDLPILDDLAKGKQSVRQGD